MATRLSKIDDLTRPDHTFLESTDDCYYLGEYTARAGYAFSGTNDLIQNLKKPMDRRGKPEWRYKALAIDRYAAILREAIPQHWLASVTFVPMPPSQMRDHGDYDDRLMHILRKLQSERSIDVRELITMTASVEPVHLTADRRSVAELLDKVRVDKGLVHPRPQAICVFDDVLTTGAHYKALQACLHSEFPDAAIGGLFLARRAPNANPI